MSKNVVELNGNVYDVRTGRLLKKVSTSSSSSSQSTNRSSAPQNTQTTSRTEKPVSASNTGVNNQPIKRARMKKSQTLMRHAVKKPSLNEAVRPNQQNQAIKRQNAAHHMRIDRAKQIAKSAKINRFHTGNNRQAGSPSGNQAPSNSSAVPTPSTETASPTNNVLQQPTANQKSKTPMQRERIEQAIDSATSHEQQHESTSGFFHRNIDRLRNIPLSIRYSFAAIVAIFALGAVGYLIAPRASVQLAANRSGVAATLPAYKPSGFQLNRSVEYSPGQVSLQFESLTDSRNFRIHKASTDWTSDALRNNFLEERGLYQTVQNRGNTIYIYNGNNATWVDGGVWYNIEGASALNTDQLLRIAESL
jgi:hypothetical protein